MTATPARTGPSPAWARVRILLNLGQIPEAVAAAKEAAQRTTWRDRPISGGDAHIHGLGDMPVGWCYLDKAQHLAVINADVADEFATSVCLMQFVRVIHSLPGPAFRFYDVANWRLLDDLDEAGSEF